LVCYPYDKTTIIKMGEKFGVGRKNFIIRGGISRLAAGIFKAGEHYHEVKTLSKTRN